MTNVHVDQETCIGCGLCVSTEPAVFRMNDDGKAQSCAPVEADTQQTVEQAVDGCPTNAIHWE